MSSTDTTKNEKSTEIKVETRGQFDGIGFLVVLFALLYFLGGFERIDCFIGIQQACDIIRARY